MSVNQSIDVSKFPVKMIATAQVLNRLLFCDTDHLMCKVDWADAYKVCLRLQLQTNINNNSLQHCPVALSDLHLNAVVLGSKVFAELSCTFGCSSSPG